MRIREVMQKCATSSLRFWCAGLLAAMLAFSMQSANAQASDAQTPTPQVPTPQARSILLANLGESAWLGMLLSTQQNQRAGKVEGVVADCVKALDKSSFDAVLDTLLREQLNEEEIRVAEDFFATEPGRKYARHGLLRVYVAAKEALPDTFPEFSDEDLDALDKFSRTDAGEKLILKKVLAKAPARLAIAARIEALLVTCRAASTE